MKPSGFLPPFKLKHKLSSVLAFWHWNNRFCLKMSVVQGPLWHFNLLCHRNVVFCNYIHINHTRTLLYFEIINENLLQYDIYYHEMILHCSSLKGDFVIYWSLENYLMNNELLVFPLLEVVDKGNAVCCSDLNAVEWWLTWSLCHPTNIIQTQNQPRLCLLVDLTLFCIPSHPAIIHYS